MLNKRCGYRRGGEFGAIFISILSLHLKNKTKQKKPYPKSTEIYYEVKCIIYLGEEYFEMFSLKVKGKILSFLLTHGSLRV